MINKILDNIKGEHWIFIIGFICITIAGYYNTGVAITMLFLLIWIGFNIMLFKIINKK